MSEIQEAKIQWVEDIFYLTKYYDTAFNQWVLRWPPARNLDEFMTFRASGWPVTLACAGRDGMCKPFASAVEAEEYISEHETTPTGESE